MGARVANLPADIKTVTFRAEYKCLCPPGYELEMGSFSNITSCTPCINGFYRAAGMPACAACPFGTYENGARTQCRACPAGTFNNGTATYYNATANILGWQTCPVLHVSTAGSSYCYPCDKLDPRTGSYFSTGGGPNTYASDSTTCTSCVDHLYTNRTASSTSLGCVRCEKGYYRFQNMTDCARAPPGMHVNEEFDSFNVYPDITKRHHPTALPAVLGGQHAAVLAATAAAERFQPYQRFSPPGSAAFLRPGHVRLCLCVDDVFVPPQGFLPAGGGPGSLHCLSHRLYDAGLWDDQRHVLPAPAARQF